LLTKRVHLSDLASSKEAREALRKRQYREIIVYDQSTVELDKLAPGHPLFLALSSLVEESREPAVLIGKSLIINLVFNLPLSRTENMK